MGMRGAGSGMDPSSSCRSSRAQGRAADETMMAGPGLYIWVPRGPASLSSLSQAAAILGWAPRVLSGLAQAGTCSERGSGPV